MAYTRHTWDCGEVITDSKMNNIEDGIEEALECCADKGYECDTTIGNTLYSGSATTLKEAASVPAVGEISYANPIDAEVIAVTFNGTEYVCQRREQELMYMYGAYGTPESVDWSKYPFIITSSVADEVYNQLVTQNGGTYSLTIKEATEDVETDRCFENAVKKVASSMEQLPLKAVPYITTEAEMREAVSQGRLIYIVGDAVASEAYYIVHNITSEAINTIPTSTHFSFMDGVLRATLQ